MQKMVAALFRFAGFALVLRGLVFLSPLSDLLPVTFSLNDLNLFSSGPSTSYYRIVPVEHLFWIEVLLIGAGAVLLLLGRYLRRPQQFI
jgi:hypothetical protein